MAITEEDLKNLSPEELMELQRKNCIFCQIAAGKVPAKTVFEDDKCIAVLDINPANLGHMLLLPKEHYTITSQIPEELTAHLFIVAKKLSQSALKAFRVRGTSIFVANGVAAGQKAPHVLIHIIPRAFNDNISLSIPKKPLTKEQEEVKDIMKRLLEKFVGREVEAEIVKEEKKADVGAGEGKTTKTAIKRKGKKVSVKKKKSSEEHKPSLDEIAELFK
jgi:histidine triad (HIT) family protein